MFRLLWDQQNLSPGRFVTVCSFCIITLFICLFLPTSLNSWAVRMSVLYPQHSAWHIPSKERMSPWVQSEVDSTMTCLQKPALRVGLVKRLYVCLWHNWSQQTELRRRYTHNTWQDFSQEPLKLGEIKCGQSEGCAHNLQIESKGVWLRHGTQYSVMEKELLSEFFFFF